MSDLVVVFFIGLFGSAHCIGMCGGFVLALSQMHERTGALSIHQTLYHVGRATTYTLMGAVAGVLGAAITSAISGAQNVLSIVLGVFLVVIGLGVVGVLKRFGITQRLVRLGPVSSALSFFLQKRSKTGTYGLGLVNGLLPCGLVYGLLVKAAATGTVVEGALTMAVFGFSTIPALFILGLTGHLAKPMWRARLNLVSGVLVILLGLITIVRGTPAMSLLHGGHGDHADHAGQTMQHEVDAPPHEMH